MPSSVVPPIGVQADASVAPVDSAGRELPAQVFHDGPMLHREVRVVGVAGESRHCLVGVQTLMEPNYSEFKVPVFL